MSREVEALKLFNKKAEKILKTRFVEKLNERKPFRISLIGVGSKAKMETILPDQDAIDAFVLTFRFFYQNNERSSFGNLARVYHDANLSPELENEFSEARKRINQYLDGTFPYNLEGCSATTMRDFFDTVLYGGLAHASHDKALEFDRLMNTPVTAEVVQMTFCSALELMLRAIVYVSCINKKAIEELERL